MVKGFGFIKNGGESYVYKKVNGSAIAFLILYVDDMLLVGNDKTFLNEIKESLKSNFSMKDVGEAAYILGIKIYRDRPRRLIGLSQSTYLDKVLKRFSMEGSKKGTLPTTHGIMLSKKHCPQTDDELDNMSEVPYDLAISSIMYAMTCTRPDVSFDFSVTSRYQGDPGMEH